MKSWVWETGSIVTHACNPSIQEVGGIGMLQVSEPAWSTQRSRLARGYLARSCLRKEEEEEKEGPVVHTWEAEAGLLEPRSSGPTWAT